MTPEQTRDLIAKAHRVKKAVHLATTKSVADDLSMLLGNLADALEAATHERDAALAAIEQVREIHVSEGWPLRGGGESKEYCVRCNCRWPCSTIAALDGAPEPDRDPGYEYVCGGKEIQG